MYVHEVKVITDLLPIQSKPQIHILCQEVLLHFISDFHVRFTFYVDSDDILSHSYILQYNFTFSYECSWYREREFKISCVSSSTGTK